MKNFRDYIEESAADKFKREYIQRVVDDHLENSKADKTKVVEYLMSVKNFGSKTADGLEAFGMSIGTAMRLAKAVKEELGAQSTTSKAQTQSQRVGSYLKQKWVK
jgi:hypothetical protein